MEVGVRLIGLFLRILNWLLTPFFFLASIGHNHSVPRIEDPILLYSVTELAAKIRSGELTSFQVVSAYIHRIRIVDPYIHAVIEDRFPAALEDAKEVDRLLEEARTSGDWSKIENKPLLGVPFTVKESCSLEGLSDSTGCLEFRGRVARSDGTAVRNLRSAGAVPLCVSATPELCLGWDTVAPQRPYTRNPLCLAKSPGGSSGGEAALIGAGASPFGVTSDIAGSIRIPAAYCGVFGYKPSPGIISIEGHVPYLSDPQYPQFLAVGPTARHAADLPLLASIMGDTSHLRLDEPVLFSYLKVFYMTEAGKSIALIDTDRKTKEMVVKAANYLEKECGATIDETKFKELIDSVDISVSMFFSMQDIPNMLLDPANPKREKNMFVELLKIMFGCGSRTLQALGFATIDKTKLFISETAREKYRMKGKLLREELERTLSTNGVLIYPVSLSGAPPIGAAMPRVCGAVYTMVYNVLGLPAVAVPPGIQIIAAPNQDRLCLAVAKKLEEAFGGWVKPSNPKT